jgi:prevent-host-death family protein
MKTKTMPAGHFKANCLAVMDEVHAKREPVVITKRGKPVAKLVPIDTETDEIFGFMKGKIKILGDIVGPVIPLDEWESLK